MKKIMLLQLLLLFFVTVKSQQLKIEVVTPGIVLKSTAENDTLIIKQEAANKDVKLKLSFSDTDKNVAVEASDKNLNSALLNTDYSYDVAMPKTYNFTARNRAKNITITVLSAANITNTIYGELELEWESLTKKRQKLYKTLVIKIFKKGATPEEVKGVETGWIADKNNYLKAEIVQYTDITGIKNDKPNGLLQFQGILKLAINKKKWATDNGWIWQPFRSAIIDATVNRIDKSKEEVDFNYTTFLYENNKATKTYNPWLATTDLWRYSNLHVGLRLVPLAIEKGNFRIQLQAGYKILKTLPFTSDTIRSGVDSGKVKADFRSVYSNVKYLELFIKTIETENKITASLNAGVMWLKLMDSYYEQIDIYQQDPFQKTIALAPVSKFRKSPPLWFTSLRIGAALGEEKAVNTFIRLSYTLQKGTYFKPMSTIVDGRPVVYEEREYFNNFFQIHIGTSFELEKIFSKKEAKDKKDDGPVSNSL